MKTFILIATSLLAAIATAYPSPSPPLVEKRAEQSDIDIILKFAPNSATCDSSTQCITAANAASPIIASFRKYNVDTAGEQAALLAWMAFESGEFKYTRTILNTNPGQGTRCMMMPNFVKQFAATENIVTADPVKLLQDVIDAGHEWDACSWYYSTMCSNAVKAGLEAGTQAGNNLFISQCVQTTMTPEREAYWVNTAKALGLSGN